VGKFEEVLTVSMTLFFEFTASVAAQDKLLYWDAQEADKMQKKFEEA
jgi:hypothetical protein